VTRASDTARILGAGATILDGTTISTADNDAQLTLQSTDADSSSGPQLTLKRDSSSPADNDSIGKIKFISENDASEVVTYAEIYPTTPDVSDGTEDGQLHIDTMVAGTSRSRVKLMPTETVLNENSVDLDFRVESDGNANAFFLEGSTSNVGIGTGSPEKLLHVHSGDSTITPNSSASLVVENNGVGIINILKPNGTVGILSFSGNSVNSDGRVAYDDSGASRAMQFYTASSERMRILSSGHVVIGKTVTTFSTAGTAFYPDGEVNFVKDNSTVVFINRLTSDGNLVQFHQAGTQEGSISISGTTTSYNGGHLSRWSQLADNTRDNTIVKGTVMTNLDQMAEWTTDGVTEDNEQLNCMAVSSVEGDANVAGVFVNWDNDDDVYTNDMNVAMTGDMVIRIAQGTTVARGDLLMSAGDGTAKPQDDDIVRSKTIAKVTSTNVSHTYDDGTYLVPCVIMAC
jgi:hypothetical protein